MSKKLYGLIVPILATALMASAAPAFAVENWEPAETFFALRSGNVTLEVTSTGGVKHALTCTETLGVGFVGTEDTLFGFTPVFEGCTAEVKVSAAKWRAQGVNATRANLLIPTRGAEVTVAAGCKIIVEESSIGAANNFVAGVAGKPIAKWTVSGSTNIKEEPVNCFNTTAQTTAPISATVTIASQSGEPVKIK